MELVTIGISSYNAETTILRAIESAVNQNYKNFEIIIVDDFSNDNTVNEINLFFNKQIYDFYYKLIIHDTNKGPAGSRNTIIANSNGKYIIFFDDDDYSYEDRITVQKNLLEDAIYKNKNDKIFCYASGRKIYNNQYQFTFEAIGSKKIFPSGNYLLNYMTHNKKIDDIDYGSGTPACSLMALKKTFIEIGFFDEELKRVEDADISIRLTLNSGMLIGTKKVLFDQFYTLGKDKSPLMNYNSEIKIIEKNRYYLKGASMYFYSKTWTKLRYNYFRKQYFKVIFFILILILSNPVYFTGHAKKTFLRRFIHDSKI